MSSPVLAKFGLSPVGVCSALCGHAYGQESGRICGNMDGSHSGDVTLREYPSLKSLGISVHCGLARSVDDVCILLPQFIESFLPQGIVDVQLAIYYRSSIVNGD